MRFLHSLSLSLSYSRALSLYVIKFDANQQVNIQLSSDELNDSSMFKQQTNEQKKNSNKQYKNDKHSNWNNRCAFFLYRIELEKSLKTKISTLLQTHHTPLASIYLYMLFTRCSVHRLCARLCVWCDCSLDGMMALAMLTDVMCVSQCFHMKMWNCTNVRLNLWVLIRNLTVVGHFAMGNLDFCLQI